MIELHDIRSKLEAELGQTDLALTELQIERLSLLVTLIDKWNKAYNLTSVRDPLEMVTRHILDSVVVAPHLEGKSFIDVGTGPGLPGLPLAICQPGMDFTLLDSLGKRIRFIRQAVHELGLKNVTPVQSRVEDFHPDTRFNGVLSRAFASLKDMLHWCEHLVDSEGVFLALKGQLSDEELTSLPGQFLVKQTIVLNVPGLDEQRHLIMIQPQ